MKSKMYKPLIGTLVCGLALGINAGTVLADSCYYYILPQSSTEYLDEEDIAGMSQQQLNYAKNEIFAKYGRQFKSPELQDYFNAISWYKGEIAPEVFDESCLNEYERANAEYLREAEYAGDADGYNLDQPGYDISLVLPELWKLEYIFQEEAKNMLTEILEKEGIDYRLDDGNGKNEREHEFWLTDYGTGEVYRIIMDANIGNVYMEGPYLDINVPAEGSMEIVYLFDMYEYFTEREQERSLGSFGREEEELPSAENSSGEDTAGFTAEEASQAIQSYCAPYYSQGGMAYVIDEYQEGDTYVLWFHWGTGFDGKYEASLIDGEMYESGPYVGMEPHEELPFSTVYIGNIADF